MTIDRITLKELIEKGSDADLLREMIAFIAGRMMELEVEGLTGGRPRRAVVQPRQSTQRLPRAGLGRRCAGTVPLEIPKLRKGFVLPGVPGAAQGRARRR